MKSKVKIKEKEFEEAVAKKNISYSELAEKIGVHSAYLSNIKSENNSDHSASPHLRQKILKLLGVEFDDIFKVVPHKDTKKK